MSLRRYALAALASAIFAGSAVAKDYELLNVSYDPTRELYQDYNAEFTNFWKAAHPGDNVKIQQSHGGSGVTAWRNRPFKWGVTRARPLGRYWLRQSSFPMVRAMWPGSGYLRCSP